MISHAPDHENNRGDDRKGQSVCKMTVHVQFDVVSLQTEHADSGGKRSEDPVEDDHLGEHQWKGGKLFLLCRFDRILEINWNLYYFFLCDTFETRAIPSIEQKMK